METVDEKLNNRSKSPLLGLVGWILICFSAAFTGMLIRPDEWYANLDKPSWNPPSWVFGPVWLTLYFMMAFSVWMVWKRGGWGEQRKPLICFVTQLVLNAAWTPLFFGLHKPELALINILLLGLAIIITMITFWRVNSTAAYLLAPYLVWVGFASYLNYTLWVMNS